MEKKYYKTEDRATRRESVFKIPEFEFTLDTVASGGQIEAGVNLTPSQPFDENTTMKFAKKNFSEAKHKGLPATKTGEKTLHIVRSISKDVAWPAFTRIAILMSIHLPCGASKHLNSRVPGVAAT